MAITLMVAGSLVWRGPAESIRAIASALDLLQQWPDRPRGSGWHSSPFGRVDAERTPGRLLIGSGDRGLGPGPGRTASLLSAPLAPGGQYEIVIGSDRPEGRLTLMVGSTTQPLDVLEVSGRQAEDRGLLFTLPVQVHSLTVQGDERARATVTMSVVRSESKVISPVVALPRKVTLVTVTGPWYGPRDMTLNWAFTVFGSRWYNGAVNGHKGVPV